MREWERREGGEWDFRGGSDWRRPGPGGEDWGQEEIIFTQILSVISPNVNQSATAKRSCCLCSEKKVSKVMLVIFILINLTMIACGGVVFTLGLTGYWADNPHFAYLMVNKMKTY